MKVEKNDNVLTVRLDVKAGWEKWFLLRSDAHHDNLHCDHALERRHLEQAREQDAHVFDFGDLFCAMQGKWDKRADQDQLRPELRGNNYLDRLVKCANDFYQPYASQFLLMGLGNHETSIIKRHQTNLTERLVQLLNSDRSLDNPVYVGGFSGWIRFLFTINKTKRVSKNLFFHHGYGGGGAVTRGVIQTNRMAVFLPDADIVCTGHTHDEWIVPIARDRLSEGGKQYRDEQVHVRTPGYKDEYANGEGGFHIERGAPPKPIGAAWLRFFYHPEKFVDFEVTRAR